MASQFDEGRAQAQGVNPLAFVVPVVILIVVIAVLAGRRNGNAVQKAAGGARSAARRGGNSPRRLMVGVLINALENDLARRAVIMGLKVARNRM